MRFDVITLFPELFAPHLSLGVTRRAFESGQVEVRLWDLRAHGDGTHQRVDDRPFGGGPGMVMLAEPLSRALAAAQADRPVPAATIIHFTPTGKRIDQALVAELSQGGGAVMLCGRYEGIDQRFLDRHVTLELSLGDFVLSGGELPALALLDGVARLQPGVLGDAQSAVQDSFSGEQGLLDCPHYSRPERWQDVPVPVVLMGGNHAAIARWRREQSLTLTVQRRPDLVHAARAAGRLSAADEKFLAGLASRAC
jgi:tRNA (guanine37-N1)-methyltransferase